MHRVEPSESGKGHEATTVGHSIVAAGADLVIGGSFTGSSLLCSALSLLQKANEKPLRVLVIGWRCRGRGGDIAIFAFCKLLLARLSDSGEGGRQTGCCVGDP